MQILGVPMLRLTLLGFAGLLVIHGAGAFAQGESAKEVSAEQVASSLKRKLTTRSASYLATLKKVVVICPTCDGSGKRERIQAGFQGGRQHVLCDNCQGTGYRISEEKIREIFEGYLSPSWWAKTPAEAAIKSFYNELAGNRADSLKSLRAMTLDYGRTNLVGNRIGFVHLKRGKTYKVIPWVLVGGEWYLWSEGDGPVERAVSIEPFQNYAPMPDNVVSEGLNVAGVKDVLNLAHIRGDTLTLCFYSDLVTRKGLNGWKSSLPASAVQMAIYFFKMCEQAKVLELSFFTQFKDSYGNLSILEFANVSIRRDVFNLIKLENLTADEVFQAHFTNSYPSHRGYAVFVPPASPANGLGGRPGEGGAAGAGQMAGRSPIHVR